MGVYISLLRGINVNGQKRIQMQELSNLYALLGFEKIITYIQSGNVVFTSKLKNKIKIAGLIENGIKEKFGFPVSVFVMEKEELQKASEGNPFLKIKGIDSGKLHITFLSEIPHKDNIKKIVTCKDDNDKMVIAGKDVYLFCPNGYGRTRLTNSFFEKKLKAQATTRNWKTIIALLELAAK